MMRVYEHNDPGALKLRSHPWIDSESNPAYRYYDFKTQPALIRSSLEDLQQWEAYPAIETFYRLLEWLNGSESILESNDSAFSGVAATAGAQSSKPLQCSGRLMILYRNLELNTSPEQMHWLTNATAQTLNENDPLFEGGAVGATIVSTRFVTLPGPPGLQMGQQLMLSFWAWGATEPEVMANLDRTLHNLTNALQTASNDIHASTAAEGRP